MQLVSGPARGADAGGCARPSLLSTTHVRRPGCDVQELSPATALLQYQRSRLHFCWGRCGREASCARRSLPAIVGRATCLAQPAPRGIPCLRLLIDRHWSWGGGPRAARPLLERWWYTAAGLVAPLWQGHVALGVPLHLPWLARAVLLAARRVLLRWAGRCGGLRNLIRSGIARVCFDRIRGGSNGEKLDEKMARVYVLVWQRSPAA
jgi:hypothetical protein